MIGQANTRRKLRNLLKSQFALEFREDLLNTNELNNIIDDLADDFELDYSDIYLLIDLREAGRIPSDIEIVRCYQ